MTDRGARPPGGGPGDDDIWAEPAAAGPGPSTPPGRRGPARPPRSGPARPPRRSRGAARPDAPTPGRRTRPGRPGGVPTDPTSGPVATVVADPVVADDGYEYEDLPAEGSLPRWLVVLIAFALLVAAVVGGAWWWYDRQIDPPGSPGDAVSVEIPRGSSTSGIGSILESQGVIPNAFVFNIYAGRQDAGPFEAGVYRLRRNSDLDLVLDTMAKGPTGAAASTEVVRVSIPEGLTVDQLLARVGEQVGRFDPERLRAAVDEGAVPTSLRPDDQKSYEGLLFPATYEVGGSTTEADFLGQLSDEMQTRVAGLDPDAAKARIRERYGIDLSTYDLLIVASLVQAEAGNVDEAPKIATVIYNRLAEDSTAWTLGIDASDAYGAEQAGVDLPTYQQGDGAYNTRRVKGLPPTPIAAPGDFALDAAFDPAKGDWMYYVLTEPRVHTFAVTDAEFQAAKSICVQKDLGCG